MGMGDVLSGRRYGESPSGGRWSAGSWGVGWLDGRHLVVMSRNSKGDSRHAGRRRRDDAARRGEPLKFEPGSRVHLTDINVTVGIESVRCMDGGRAPETWRHRARSMVPELSRRTVSNATLLRCRVERRQFRATCHVQDSTGSRRAMTAAVTCQPRRDARDQLLHRRP